MSRTSQPDQHQENLIIKGDNLVVLRALKDRALKDRLKERLVGQVQLIYIDPPYNTGKSTFTYPDKLEQGQWLDFMRERLRIGRDFLCETGVMVVSIDNHKFAYLKVLLDEVFGRDNFVVNFVWQTKKGSQGIVTENRVVNNHENLLVFAKSKGRFKFKGLERDEREFSNPDDDPRGKWKRQYLQRFGQGFPRRTITNPENGMAFTFETPYTEDKISQWIKDKVIIFPQSPNKYPMRKEYLKEYKAKKQLVSSLGLYSTKSSTEELYNMFDGEKVFKNPKPKELIKFIVDQTTNPHDLVLDFFAGSGTTAQAVLELNQADGGQRKFILVEQVETNIKICKARVEKVLKVLAKKGMSDGFIYEEFF